MPAPFSSSPDNKIVSTRHQPTLPGRVVSCYPHLSPVDEDMNPGICEDLAGRAKEDLSCLLSPSGPAAKKQRIMSPISVSLEVKSPLKFMSSNDDTLDATISLAGSSSDEISIESIDSKEKVECVKRKKLRFDLFRHQSTPVTNSISNLSPESSKAEHKHPFQLSRCVSVPAFVDIEKVSFVTLFLNSSTFVIMVTIEFDKRSLKKNILNVLKKDI